MREIYFDVKKKKRIHTNDGDKILKIQILNTFSVNILSFLSLFNKFNSRIE